MGKRKLLSWHLQAQSDPLVHIASLTTESPTTTTTTLAGGRPRHLLHRLAGRTHEREPHRVLVSDSL